MINIFNLTLGATAKVVEFPTNSQFIERLKEFGLIPGTVFTLVRRAPLGGPIEIKFGESRLALRSDTNDLIYVEPVLH
ncbi:MAG: FeoA family protein [Candidatus Kapaibacterium sp.]|nr:ferrous iron transport protein A [Bacteroidota bacterium]